MLRGPFSYKNNRAGPGRNYILALVVSVAIAPSAGAVVPAAAAVSVLMVEVVDSVAGVVVVSVVVVSVAGFDSHEVRPTARNRAAADTFNRLVILR